MKISDILFFRAVGLCVAVSGFLSSASPAGSATLTVTSLDDSGPGSLRQAIADAAPEDTIDFAVTGVITLTNGQLVIEKDLFLHGPGPTNLTVSGNHASRVLYVSDATLLVSGITLADAYTAGDHGGGIHNRGSGALTLSNCVIKNCTSDYAGGGIFTSAAATVSIERSTIAGNTARFHSGGGIYASGYVAMRDSTVSANSADGAGGMAMVSGGSLVNCTVSGNITHFRRGAGGGIFAGGPLHLTNCTVAFNKASEHGGGIFGGPVIAWNSVIAANGTTPGFPRIGSPDCSSGSFLSLGYNLIQNINGCVITGDTTHNIYGKDPLLGPLADDGGPTPTHALLPGSPAIDHGSGGGSPTDQRGQPRGFNFPAYFDADDASDIGAYELQEGPQAGPVFTVNTSDDTDDGVASLAHCSLREAIHTANAYPGSASILFARDEPDVHTGVGALIALTGGELLVTNHLNVTGPGANALSISGNNASRVFHIVSNQIVTLAGLTIADGRTNNSGGGGVLSSGRLTVIGCVVSNCSGSIGGGLRNLNGTLEVDGCLLISNRAVNALGGSGGGIGNDGSLLVARSIIYGNRAGLGGGVFNWSGTASLLSSTLAGNEADNGGGLRNDGTNVTVTHCTISGNSANFGGGVYNLTGALALDSCTLAGNSATNSGGGIYNARGVGFPLNIPAGRVSLRNIIVAGNLAGVSAPDIRTENTTFIDSGDYNLIQDTNGCAITNLTAHNLYGVDPKLGPLADLGGPTPAHALRFDSPALDAGHRGGLLTDQRGLPRTIDDPNTPNAADGDGTDIGAYEADPSLRFTRIEKAGADIQLWLNTVLGRSYRVESADDLNHAWSTRLDNIAGTGSRIQLQNAGATELPRRFYRAVQTP
jgi:CSLREA domain-containing protein